MYADIMNYLKSIQETNPVLSVALGAIFYMLFPEQSYFVAACTVMILAVLDVLTKYYAISVQHGGLIKAFRNRIIDSEIMWRGTSRKLFTYLILFIMTGLSYRVVAIAGASVMLSTIVYSLLFFKECQSILRNMQDAGSDVGWMLSIISKKQKKILEDEGVNEDELDN